MPDLARRLAALLPPGLGLGQGADLPLWPGEELTGALPARLAEFRAGRAAARAAMVEAGFAAAPVPVNPDRSPRWPAGVRGSISHCAGACLALAGAARDWDGLGLDLEPIAPIEPALWPSLLTADELARLPGDGSAGIAVLGAFCAKEAAYKAQFALSRQMITFQDLEFDGQACRFLRAVPPYGAGHRLRVDLVRTSRHLAALCLVPVVLQ